MPICLSCFYANNIDLLLGMNKGVYTLFIMFFPIFWVTCTSLKKEKESFYEIMTRVHRNMQKIKPYKN